MAHAQALADAGSGMQGLVGPAQEQISSNGWSTQTVSPFWSLLWMRQSFYKCFGICFLHLELLGLVKVRGLYHILTCTINSLFCSLLHSNISSTHATRMGSRAT